MSKNVIVEAKSIINQIVKYKKEEKPNEPNEAIHKFSEHIRGLILKYEPDNIAVIFPKDSDLLDHEASVIRNILLSMGVACFDVPSEMIGHHIHSLKKSLPGDVLISSLSSSMLQHIDQGSKVLRFDTNDIITESSLKSIMGIEASMIKDFVAMSGDPDFGIETIVGHKMSIDWLKKYGDLQSIIKNTDKLNKVMGSLVSMKSDDIMRQRAICDYSSIETFYDAIPVSSVSRAPVNEENLNQIYIENKLFEWLPDDLRKKHTPKINLGSDITYSIEVNSEAGRHSFANNLIDGKGISFSRTGDFCAFSITNGESYVLNITSPDNMSLVKDILSNKEQKIVTHDAKSLMHWANRNGFEINNLVSDSAILAYTIDTSNKETRYTGLSKDFLGINVKTSLKAASEEDKIRVAGESSDLILRLNKMLYLIANKDGRSRYIFEKLELPLIKTLFNMEKEGVHVDVNKIKDFEVDLKVRINKIQNEINFTAKETIQLSKPADVGKYLFDILKVPEQSKKGSERSTAEEVLSKAHDVHYTVPMISEYRKLDKLMSTYVSPYLLLLDKGETKIYSNFMQNVTSTSRLSSRNPNLQAIPIRSEEGRKLRGAFTALEDGFILAVDYSQMELRILAHLSKDEALIEAFNSGADIHLITASKVFNIPPSEITGEQRRYAKAINFGIVYKMTPFGLSKKLDCSPEQATRFIDSYFSVFPGVKTYIDHSVKLAREKGYTETLFGRKQFHPNIRSSNQADRGRAERAAVNAPMQGTASDIIKLAMNRIMEHISEHNLKSKMLIQVHDELVFNVDKSEQNTFPLIAKKIMESSARLVVPLVADADIGKDWASSHSLESFKKNIEQEMVV
ncbi:DNA polymerase [Psychromonas sp. SP041]|uniref:DNA polymerase n=1 Tax=Psychromonas sp. SP041 TaxID=1365007 RepID=UPI0010C79500|nr:DNA polymerase [Psychromonas sp. SP041]